MVLDKFYDPKILNQKPFYAVPTAFFFVILAFICSKIIFASEISIVMVAFSSLLILPYVRKIFEFDELDVSIEGSKSEDLQGWVVKCLRDGFTPKQIKDSLVRDNIDKPYSLMYDLAIIDELTLQHVEASNPFSRHKRTIQLYGYLFIGMFMAYAILYNVLPEATKSLVFENQLAFVKPGAAGYMAKNILFKKILSNNLMIIAICVFLSLIYGSGAIFILNYNASIAGVLFGSSLGLLTGTGIGFLSNPIAFIPHTVIEILAYLMAAISGAILSKAAAKVLPGSPKILVKDGLIYFALSLALVIVGAILEVNVLFGLG